MPHMPAYEGPPIGAPVYDSRKLIGGTAITIDGGASADLTADRTIAVVPAALADLVPVATDGVTITGNGTTGSPLVGASSTVHTDGLSILGTGAIGSPLTGASITAINVLAYAGVDSTGATDSRAGLMNAFAAAIAAKLDLYFPPGRYLITKYLYVTGASRLRVFGRGATIVYPSDNQALVADGTANNNNAARSAILMKYCKHVTFEGVGFEGGQSILTDSANIGAAVYERNCRRTTMRDCKLLYGGSLHQQDQQPDTNGTGDSLAVAAGVVTLTDAAALFLPGHVDSRLTINNCTNPANHGTFTITAYISATQVQYKNSEAVAEVSSFRWVVEDGDFGTLMENCDQDRARHVNSLPSYSEVRGGTYRWPTAFMDMCGCGDMLAIAGTTVTLTDAAGRFTPTHDGKYIQIAGATTGANNGIFKLTYISATQVSWTNAAGAAEVYPGNWWIMNAEKTGLGAGAGAWTVAAGVATLTSATASFTPLDVGKALLLRNPANNVNRDQVYQVASYISPTQITTVTATAVAEAFAGVWTLDSFDETGAAGIGAGSTHAFYIFSGNNGVRGREHILFDGVTFIGNRTCCIKGSGSASPLRDILVRNCKAYECGGFVAFGADDAQEHAGITVIGNTLVDCGQVHRRGQMYNEAIFVLGARGVLISGNVFYYTREAVAHQIGSTGGLYAVHVYRYVTGNSQPVEDVHIVDNKFIADPSAVQSAGNICDNAIRIQQVGRREKYDSEGTFAKVGNVMTLTAPHANFLSTEDVGKKIKLVNSSVAGDDGTFTIETAPTPSTLTFTNAIGTDATTVGTYRIAPRDQKNSAGCVVARNYINVGGYGVYCTSCVAPQITDNEFQDLIYNVYLDANAFPVVTKNRELGASNNTGSGGGVHPRIVCTVANSWPMIWDNWVSSPPSGAAHSRAWDISIDGTNKVDHPLLGKTVRVLPTFAREEIVFAYGAGLVDGDTITVNGTALTYKTAAPGANQFNSMTGLIALINALAGLSAEEYGASFAVPVVSGHVRVRKTATTSADGTFAITSSTLSSGALALLYNDSTGGNTSAKSVGSGTGAGPTPDKVVVWSPMQSQGGVIVVAPDNADGRTILQANGALPVKNPNNSGACEVINVGDCTAKLPEFRAVVR